MIWGKKKKAAGQNIHYLFTFKACFKVELFVETAAQVALRQWISEGYSKRHLFIYFNISGHRDPGTSKQLSNFTQLIFGISCKLMIVNWCIICKVRFKRDFSTSLLCHTSLSGLHHKSGIGLHYICTDQGPHSVWEWTEVLWNLNNVNW